MKQRRGKKKIHPKNIQKTMQPSHENTQENAQTKQPSLEILTE
jgi:hypothetical protein